MRSRMAARPVESRRSRTPRLSHPSIAATTSLWGGPRRAALQTAVTKQPRTRHGGRQYGHLLESYMVLEHLLQHAIGGGFFGRGKFVHSAFR